MLHCCEMPLPLPIPEADKAVTTTLQMGNKVLRDFLRDTRLGSDPAGHETGPLILVHCPRQTFQQKNQSSLQSF